MTFVSYAFLVGNAVARTWRYDEGRVQIEPFARRDRAGRRELESEAERLSSCHAPAAKAVVGSAD